MAQQTMVYGKIQDASTFEPVPFAHVATSKKGTVSNLEGQFRIPVDKGDTIYFSHVNYEPYQLAIREQDSLLIFLDPGDILLDEITIRSIPSEEKFKKMVLETQITETKSEGNAMKNVGNARKLVRAGFGPPTVSSPDSYKVYVEGPEGVSIFSSNPSKGLFKAFRNLKKKLPVFQPYQEMSDLPDFRLKRQNPPDSTTLYGEKEE